LRRLNFSDSIQSITVLYRCASPRGVEQRLCASSCTRPQSERIPDVPYASPAPVTANDSPMAATESTIRPRRQASSSVSAHGPPRRALGSLRSRHPIFVGPASGRAPARSKLVSAASRYARRGKRWAYPGQLPGGAEAADGRGLWASRSVTAGGGGAEGHTVLRRPSSSLLANQSSRARALRSISPTPPLARTHKPFGMDGSAYFPRLESCCAAQRARPLHSSLRAALSIADRLVSSRRRDFG